MQGNITDWGKEVKKGLIERGWSINDLAERIGKSRTRVCITKQSTSKPNDTTVKDDGVISKTPQWVGKVTADVLNVRTWAGTNNPLIKSYPQLRNGNLVDVCDVVNATDGSRWYYVRIAGKYYGFVHSAYIARS